MIIERSIFRETRTIWRCVAEPGDEVLPRNDLWIEGLLRNTPAEAEAIWLALILRNFAKSRLVVPRAVPVGLSEILEILLGIPVISDSGSSGCRNFDGEYRATLIRDELDIILMGMLRKTSHFGVAIHVDEGELNQISASLRFLCNVGSLARYKAPLDGLGELATLFMLCTALNLRRITSFQCREELGSVETVAIVVKLAQEIGIFLDLPFANVSVCGFPEIARQLGLPVPIYFRGLYRRYRMFPRIMGIMYRQIGPALKAMEAGWHPEISIAKYMTKFADGQTVMHEEIVGLAHTFMTSSQ